MKQGDEFYKIEALVSKSDVDLKLKHIYAKNRHSPSVIFEALEDNGIKVYEISVHIATARIEPESMTLDVSVNGLSTNRKGFKRHEIEK